MISEDIKLDAFQLLEQRYPQLAFYLQFFPYESFECFEEEGLLNAKKEQQLLYDTKKPWQPPQQLDQIDIIYLYGIGLGYEAASVFGWLEKQPGRLLILLEDDLGAIALFLKGSDAARLLEHPRVHLIYAEANWDKIIEDLAHQYPTEKIEVLASSYYQKKKRAVFKKLWEQLMRSSALFSALYSEVLFADHLLDNLIANFYRLESSFYGNLWKGSLKNVPVIICGAGPSLESSFDALKKLQNHACIIAGGSSAAALIEHGIRPHLIMALDPNRDELQRFKGVDLSNIPFLFSGRLQKDVLSQTLGPWGYLKSNTGGLMEEWLEKQLDIEGDPIGAELGKEAFSVTTLAIAYAQTLGCDPIILTGVDLSFSGEKRYAQGVKADLFDSSLNKPKASEKILIKKNLQGNSCKTMMKWIMEADCLGAFAKQHTEHSFINATVSGLKIPHMQHLSFKEIADRYGFIDRDLNHSIQQMIEKTKMTKASRSHVKTVLKKMEHSLKSSLGLVEKICIELEISEQPKILLFEIELKEIEAYDVFLMGAKAALNQILVRFFPEDPRKKEITIWKELKAFNERLLLIFHNHIVSS